MNKEYRVNVINDNGDVLGRVRYNNCLDIWDGRNWSSGGTGMHKGLTRLKSGEYVLILGTQWQGQRDTAHVISAEEALQEILKSNDLDLLDRKKFKELKELYKKSSGDLEELEEE